MRNYFTPDVLMVSSAITVAVLCVPLWIFAKVRCNGGVAELPSMLMFGGTNKYL